MQIRLRLFSRNCSHGMRDPLHSRIRRLSPVQRVRASQLRGAPLDASVLAGPSASRRVQLAARSSALVWELGQSRQPLFRAHRIYDSDSDQRLGQVLCAPPLRTRVNRVTAERRAKNPLGVVQNIKNLTNLALVPSQTSSARPQCPGSKFSRCRASMSTPAKPWEIDTQERSRREELARAGRSLGAQHGRA